MKDVRWIADATVEGRILVGADRRILRNPLERRAICLTGALYIVFGTNNLSTGRLLELFERNLPAIQRLTAVPGVQRIAQHGMDRLPLDCADV